MPAAGTIEAPSPDKIFVLIIDDDYSIREAMQDMLEFEGYHVATAIDGREGIEKLRNLPTPRMVLLDMMMPVMNGREFLDTISSDSFLAPIPVLVISATADDVDCHGAKGVLKKPVNLDSLLRAMQSLAASAS